MTDEQTDDVIACIAAAFAARGHLDYGERITMREHMLQAAWLAVLDGAHERLVVATLLHDYGHLVCSRPNDTFDMGENNHHEKIGADALGHWFERDIVNAVRLHVDAKRYLCAADPEYLDKLSGASKLTLDIQGGPMRGDELRAFERLDGHEMALRVRRYDDLGKQREMERPDLDYHFPAIRACLRAF